MMTGAVKGNPEATARSPVRVGSLSLTKTDHDSLYGRRWRMERRSCTGPR